MSAVGMLDLLFWVFFFWQIFGRCLGILTRKEWLSIQVIIDAIIIVTNLVEFVQEFGSAWCLLNGCFVVLFSWWLKRDYKRWKNTDDDDEWKGRRKTWVKNKLPKPVTKQIPVPV